MASKDIKIYQPSLKLGPRQLGLCKVLEWIGNLDYHLKLSPLMTVHSVFYVNCLSPYWDNGFDKPPPPDSVKIEDEEEYEVKKITNSRIYYHKLQYRALWKSFGEGEALWEPTTNLAHALKLIEAFYLKCPQAPCRLAASIFFNLQSFFCPLSNVTTIDASLFPDLANLKREFGVLAASDTCPSPPSAA